jgi:uncharacterized protein YjbJ (UPF0337 family)
MDHDQMEGGFKQIKGKAKAAWGELTGDRKRELEGKTEDFGGKVQEKMGDAKESVRREIDRADRRRIDEEEGLI